MPFFLPTLECDLRPVNRRAKGRVRGRREGGKEEREGREGEREEGGREGGKGGEGGREEGG